MKDKSRNKDGRHPFKWMKFDGNNVRIDKDIASIIPKMWKLGIRTTNCCQNDGGRGRVWIVFEQSQYLERFYDVVAMWEPPVKLDGMYAAVNGWGRDVNPDVWIIETSMRNDGIQGHWGRPIVEWSGKKQRSPQELWVEEGCKKNNFRLTPHLWFPRKHISYVEERLDLALSKKKK